MDIINDFLTQLTSVDEISIKNGKSDSNFRYSDTLKTRQITKEELKSKFNSDDPIRNFYIEFRNSDDHHLVFTQDYSVDITKENFKDVGFKVARNYVEKTKTSYFIMIKSKQTGTTYHKNNMIY